GPKKQSAKLDLSGFTSVDAIVREHGTWDLVLERLEAGEMPPEKAPQQPSKAERQAIIDWITALRDREGRRNAGDPGTVLARRLSSAEYDNTIRDLTGVDIRPTREFPVDPANTAGFDNSGESLTMSPALVRKYLAAARLVADHVVLKPEGFVFAPHPAVTETDRDKYCVRRIIDFYQKQPTDLAAYFFAAWQYRHRAQLNKPDATLNDFAREAGVSRKYLATLWDILNEAEAAPGPLGEVQTEWRKLPEDPTQADAARQACKQLGETVQKLRQALVVDPGKVQVKGMSPGSQPLVLWRNRQQATRRMVCIEKKDSSDDAALQEARARFCREFPDAFYNADRGAYFDPKGANQGRLLTAGFHLMQGYFRDDAPLCELILDDAERAELDALWRELDFVTLVPIRQYKDYIFFERAEPPQFMGEKQFDFARSEDKDVVSVAKMQRVGELVLEKARKVGASDDAVGAIETYFRDMSASIRWVEETRLQAEPSHLATLQEFASRAYRRPLTTVEKDDLVAFYRLLREQDELGHEEAIRDTLVAILMSPHFCYRFDLAAAGSNIQPLDDHELASRLSYFVWSSMPDAELLAHAAAG
ncbi:MAG TPA: DUF1587 domain-containing protein, partial [Planctomycetaceae bacterium]|nr:DUF1587 domain-containing protein [Planctomycetaceae bacterium]